MSWHAGEPLLVAYAAGDIDDARAFSLEAHLLACPSCRSACARLAGRTRLDEAWAEIVDRVDRPRQRVAERVLMRLGMKGHTARLLGATPSLQLSWFAAVAAALAFGVLAAYAGDRGLLMFLIMAPLLPLAGVAAAYGPGIDPTYEIGLAAPMRGFLLLMVRAGAVLTSSTVLAGIASLFLPRLDWTAAAWLLPALALTTAGLALSTVLDPVRAAGIVGVAWVTGVLVVERLAHPSFAAFRGTGQLVFLALALLGVWIVGARRDRFEITHDE